MMATFANIYKIEPRPCYVTLPKRLRKSSDETTVKALFHLWSQEGDLLRGQTVSTTMAIVEFEDGKVEKVPASYVRFCDSEIKKYAFLSVDTADKEEKNEV